YKVLATDLTNGITKVVNDIDEESWYKSDMFVEQVKNGGTHYQSSGIEPINFIMSNKLDFCRGNIIKYAFRAGKKQGEATADITKIIHYALFLAEQENIEIDWNKIRGLVK
ncbi:MAG: DUF3310 domain-containing protein, partial [Fusobacteriaceae bacterium]